MTGNFRLISASKICRCGIKFHAVDAPFNKLKWASNLLGKVLQEVRAELQLSEPGLRRGYAFEFWRLWEEMLNEERYMKLKPEEAKLPNKAELPRKRVMAELKKMREEW